MALADVRGEVTDSEKKQGLHGIDVSNAKPHVDTFEMPVCFVCEIQNGKIRRAREYWDSATVARQMGLLDRDRQ